jgi:adenosylcobinamide-GDP ribazoletransferase
LVGAGIGALLAVVWRVCAVDLGAFVTAVLVVALSMVLTGALHEDGLADTADALGGATSRERVFQILKDSRIGTYGAAALVISLLLRIALLIRLDSWAPIALIAAHCAARLPPVALLTFLPYVTPETQKSSPFAASQLHQVLVAATWVLACAATLVALDLLSLRAAFAALGVLALVAVVCGQRFQAHVGGVTGDFLGATEQIGECALLVLFVMCR